MEAFNAGAWGAGPRGAGRDDARAFLAGGGIASLAAAAFMIRDGDMLGRDITVPEELRTAGGSLDGFGTPEDGCVLRGGRVLEGKHLCTFGLFASIPILDDSMPVTREIEQWNRTMPMPPKSRLVRKGSRQTAPRLGLYERHILAVERLELEPEGLLGRTTIAGQLDPTFFTSPGVLHQRGLVRVMHHLRLPALARRGRARAPRDVRA